MTALADTNIETTTPYRITVEPVEGRVRVDIDGAAIADSEDVMVMHETYLPSHLYFGKSDLIDGLLEPSELRTFCPFKGTAHHWHLRLGERLVENGAWSYEQPLHDATPVGGRVAFYPQAIGAIVHEDEPAPAEKAIIGGSPLIDWLMRGAWLCPNSSALTEGFAERLLEIGIPLWRFNVSIWTLHSELAGKNYNWTRGRDGVVESDIPYGTLQSPAYLNSPLRHVSDGLGGVRQRLDIDDPEFRFPIFDELRAGGGTDYVAMPLPFSGGQIQTMTLATDAPEGFTTGHLGRVFESVLALGRFYEVLTLRRNTSDLFGTYLGERTAHKILGGLTHRGDGEDIRAAILYCDMRGSTSLTESLSRETYLDLLNDFFEHAAEPVQRSGGEVLKFIGDAVLAIFPLEGDNENEATVNACTRAREAAQEIVRRVDSAPRRADRPHVQCAIGVHFGDVTYGNVGAQNRLDFTVIGPAANIAARLSSQCKALEQSLLLSTDVARHVPSGLHSLGNQRLRDVANELEVFVVSEGQFG